MGFLIYNKTIAGETVRYERIQPLKLGGPDGLIARHVKSLLADEIAGWKLAVAGLLKLADFAGENLAVLFDAASGDATTVCLYELVRIHGSCRDTRTNLALDFNIVLDRATFASQPDFTAAFEAPLVAIPKKLGEVLSLTGGPHGGDWKWGKPALQVGATVVQRATPARPSQTAPASEPRPCHDRPPTGSSTKARLSWRDGRPENGAE